MTETVTQTGRLEERLEAVRHRVHRAAARADRDPAAVEVLPVTKGHSSDVVRAVAGAGFSMIGENRVGEAVHKREQLGSDLGLRWHMIGHLQRNKAADAVVLFDVIESVDSLRLARRLSLMAEREERAELPVLVQVNTSGEATKGGFGPEELEDALPEICTLPRLAAVGLMTMAPLTDDEDWLRATFRRARQLFDRCGSEVDGFTPAVLSMGMSNDFEIAVEEGSTRLRLGTVLLGERPEP